MTDSHNHMDKDLKPYSEPNNANESSDLTFIHAQLAYAKSKQGRQAKRKQTAYKKRWIKRGGINE